MMRFAGILTWLGDFGHGLILALVASLVADVPLSVALIIWAIVWSVLPDVDVLLEWARHRKVHYVEGDERDHRDNLHYPLFWLLPLGIYAWFEPVWGSVALIAVAIHFFNDSWGTGWGIAWLYPFSKTNYKFFTTKWVSGSFPGEYLVVSYTPEEKRRAMRKHGEADWLQKYFLRVSYISVVEYGTFLIGLIVVMITLLV